MRSPLRRPPTSKRRPQPGRASNVYNVTVKVSDGLGGIDTQAITVTVTDVNEAPTAVTLTNTLALTPENGAAVKVADITVTDDALGSNTLTLSGADASAFQINTNKSGGKELWFKGGADFETKAGYQVTVNAADSSVAGSAPVSANFSLSIADVNEAPTAVTLSNLLTSTPENGGPVKVADITVADDALGTNALTLTGADASAFQIVTNTAGGHELWFRGGANFETKQRYRVTVVAADSSVAGSAPVSTNVSLSIDDINEVIALYSAADGNHGTELWATDGTSAVMLGDIFLGGSSSNPSGFTALGSRLIFQATDPTHGRELWATDGTPVGTLSLKDIFSGPGDSNADRLHAPRRQADLPRPPIRPTAKSCGRRTARRRARCL